MNLFPKLRRKNNVSFKSKSYPQKNSPKTLVSFLGFVSLLIATYFLLKIFIKVIKSNPGPSYGGAYRIKKAVSGTFHQGNTRGDVYLEAVLSEAVQLALLYLKQNNPFYHDIRIDIDNFSDDLQPNQAEDSDQEIPICVQSNKEGENPLDSYLWNSEEKMLTSLVPTLEEISISTGEGKKPSSILQDNYCE